MPVADTTFTVKCECGKVETFPAVFPLVFRCDCAATIVTSLDREPKRDDAEADARG